MSEQDHGPDAELTPAEPAPDDAAARRRRWPLVVGALGIVAVVLIALPVVSTLQPAYYKRYPSLHTRMQNWRVSTHARVACSGCHVDPGAAGLLRFAGKAIPAFYSQLLEGPKPTNLLSTPSRAACQKCHTSYRQVSANGDLLIPHKAHVEVLGVKCATCHKDLVHSSNSRGYNSPEMSMCLAQCHDGTQATKQCADCHTRKHVPDSHRKKNWLQVHSAMAGTTDCGACHAWSPDFCKECHSKRPKAHVGNWKKNHAVPAKARGDKGCLVCHDKKFCKECHD